VIAAGRRDSVVGYTDAVDLLERYPHATLAVIDDAGHALMHERAELFGGCLVTGSIALAHTMPDSAICGSTGRDSQ
jgi:pimeloyl-ACP methyl ester carboxylesterase